MFKFKVMGKMKWLSHMVEDGSFEQDFVPKYNKAVENNQPYFTYAGTTVPIYQAKAMMELGSKAIGNKQRINFIKDLER